jgi:hypothetical protein
VTAEALHKLQVEDVPVRAAAGLIFVSGSNDWDTGAAMPTFRIDDSILGGPFDRKEMYDRLDKIFIQLKIELNLSC